MSQTNQQETSSFLHPMGFAIRTWLKASHSPACTPEDGVTKAEGRRAETMGSLLNLLTTSQIELLSENSVPVGEIRTILKPGETEQNTPMAPRKVTKAENDRWHLK